MDNFYDSIFEEILLEAEEGKIWIIKEDELYYHIGFHSKNKGENKFWHDMKPVLIIRNKRILFDTWRAYVEQALCFYPHMPYSKKEQIKKMC